MFTLQQSQIQAALARGGLAPDAATEVASVLGNCMAILAHRGPVQLDYTPKSFDYVTPEMRKYQFPGMDNQSMNPDFVPSGGDFSETGSPPSDDPISEPRDVRPGFGPGIDPEATPDGGGGAGGGGGPTPMKVVTRIWIHPQTKKWMVQYAWVLCWPLVNLPPEEWAKTRQVRVISRLHIGQDKIYADKYKVSIPIIEDLFDLIELDAANCET
jgi:hypothetical protein